MKALLQEQISSGKVRCNVCAFRCELSDGQVGICRVRRNDAGTINYLAYETQPGPCQMVDKCGAGSYCIDKPSCNWSCSFCCSSGLTLPEMESAVTGEAPVPLTTDGFTDKDALRGRKLSVIPLLDNLQKKGPADVVADWKASGKEYLGFRQSEPSIHLEAVRDIFTGVKEAGGKVVIDTNGYWTPETLEILGPLLDNAEVGFKGSGNRTFLRKVSGVPKTEPIFETVRGLVHEGVEVMVSDIPVWHRDCLADMRELYSFVSETVPQRSYPRLRLSFWWGRIPSVAFGYFRTGVPCYVGQTEEIAENRAALMLNAVQVALESLESVWVSGLGLMKESERQAFAEGLNCAWVQEGHLVRAARSEADLGELVTEELVASA